MNCPRGGCGVLQRGVCVAAAAVLDRVGQSRIEGVRLQTDVARKTPEIKPWRGFGRDECCTCGSSRRPKVRHSMEETDEALCPMSGSRLAAVAQSPRASASAIAFLWRGIHFTWTLSNCRAKVLAFS